MDSEATLNQHSPSESDSIRPTYTKRPGTAAVGQFYETKLLTVILFRLLHDDRIERFYLGNNLDEAGAFDDLVFRTNIGGKPHVYCLQAKHRKAGTWVNFGDLINMQKSGGDFHLSKYFNAYLKIRYMFCPGSNHVIFRGAYEQIELELIILTPAKLVFKNSKFQWKNEIDDKKLCSTRSGQIVQIKCGEVLLKCFKVCVRNVVSEILAKLILFYNYDTSDLRETIKNLKRDNVLKRHSIESNTFNYEALLQLYNNQQIMNMNGKDIKVLCQNIGKIIQESLLPSHEELVHIVNDFLGKLRFYTEQATEDELDEIIMQEMKSKNYESPDLIFSKSHNAVERWWKESGEVSYLDKGCKIFKVAVYEMKLDKIHSNSINRIRTNLINFDSEKLFSSDLLNHARDPKGDEQLFLNIFSSTPEFSCVKIVQSLQALHIDFKFIIINFDETHQIFEVLTKVQPRHLLVIYLSEFKYDIICIIRQFVSRLIVITKQEYCDNLKSIQDETEDILNFTTECQKRILEIPVTFQGSSVALRRIMNKAPREMLDSRALQKLIYGGGLKISCISLAKDNEDPTLYYIERDLHDNRWRVSKPIIKIDDKVVVVAAEPGMGKSTLLTGLGMALKKTNPSCWIVRINLLNYTKQFDQWNDRKIALNKTDAINFLLEIMSSDKCNIETFEKKIFRWYCEHFKVILLIDGFDEISPFYTNTVLQMLKLYKNNFTARLWVTTRTGGFQKALQGCLEVQAYSLKPFTMEEAKLFLINFWSAKLNIEQDRKQMLHDYVEQLILHWSQSIDIGGRELISVPQQIKMIAMIFLKDLLNYFEESEYLKPFNKFNLVNLYEKFVEFQFTGILMEEKNKTDISKPISKQQAKESFKKFENIHKQAAVYALFNQVDLQKLLSQIEIEAVQNFLEEVQNSIEKTGIITQVIDGKPIFMHQTYAEYFAAQLIWERFCSVEIENFKRFVDSILIKAVIESDQNQIAKFLRETTLSKDKQCPKITIKGRMLLQILRDIRLTHYKHVSFDVLFGIVESAINLEAENGTKVIKKFLKRDTNDSRGVLLWIASKNGYIGLAHLVTDKSTVKMTAVAEKYGWTALHFAVHGGHENIVEHLLRFSCCVNKTIESKTTALHIASRKGNYAIVKMLLDRGANVNLKDKHDNTALNLAVQKGYTNIVSLLLEKGTKINRIPKDGETDIYLASREGYLEIVQLLIKHGANVNIRPKTGETPLYAATRNCHLDTVRVLLENNSNPNIKISDIGLNFNDTPLHEACIKRDVGIAELLINSGADINLKTKYKGYTPLHIAAWKDCPEIIKMLISKGANIHCDSNDDYQTPLYMAVWQKKINSTKTLLELGANVNLGITNNNHTPLHCAAKGSGSNLIQILVDHGANINSTTTDHGRTPLHEAVGNGSLNAVKILLNLGADLNLHTNTGLTPLDIAVNYNRVAIRNILIKKSVSNASEKTDLGVSKTTQFSRNANKRRATR